MTAATREPSRPTRDGSAGLLARVIALPPISPRRAGYLVERTWLITRHTWLIIVSGFFEPLFYLLSIGIGIGALVGTVTVDGQLLDYTVFVAPGLLASSAMNGAVYDSTFNIFFKLKYAKTYDAILSTPMSAADTAAGEITWALLRGMFYSAAFLLVMLALGLVASPWALLALPACLLIGFAFAAVGMAATTYMRGWQDFSFVNLAVMPMFLFATTFYPLSTYPEPLQWVVACTPLYHAVELVRGLTIGLVDASLVVHVAYLAVMGLLGLRVAAGRLEKLLLR
ncbi:MAG: ABC transporter permease [Geodermatophilaceae bacterium]|jgi:lipooligosaccharide transport system permease protein|nr:ABC transporter permease [Geodermatophilaceae bacterium]MDQ3455223.1 ABC transporter permease [Actinomycetota bacterium]